MNRTPCEEIEIAIVSELAGELDAAEREALRQHVAGCARCAAEVESLGRIWSGLGGAPAEGPSPFLAARFERMLAREIEELAPAAATAAPRGPAVSTAPAWRRLVPLAATLALGLGLGWVVAAGRGGSDVADLRREIGSLKEMMAVSLLSDRPSSERLRAVAYGREQVANDPRIADALLGALAIDPDVNVRLAALEAIAPALRLPAERARLVRVVSNQDSPLVQLSAIDLLLAADGAAARRDLEALAANPDLDPTVASYLRSRLGRRI